MQIVGALTEYGSTALANYIANGTEYEIYSVVAGDGQTATNATVLNKICHHGDIISQDIDGVEVLTATFAMNQANKNYQMKEIGVNIKVGTNIKLFKYFKLSEPINVIKTDTHCINFTLRDVDLANAINNGFVEANQPIDSDDVAQIINDMNKPATQTESIDINGSNLVNYLESMPDLIDKHYVFNVSGTVSGLVNLENKYGNGSITFDGDCNASEFEDYTLFSNGLTATDCNIPIKIMNFRSKTHLTEADRLTSFYLENCTDFTVEKMGIIPDTGENILMAYNSNVKFLNSSILTTADTAYFRIYNGSVLTFDYTYSLANYDDFTHTDAVSVYSKSDCKVVVYPNISETELNKFNFSMNQSMLVVPTYDNNIAQVRIY